MPRLAVRAAVLTLAVVAVLPAAAQVPDCSGISDVSAFDGSTVSDMAGFLTTVRIASGFTQPLWVGSPPGDASRLFVIEQRGVIRIVENGAVLPQPFLDIAAIVRSEEDGGHGEEGLLGMVFDPAFDANRRFFVYYTEITGDFNVVDRYTVDAGNPNAADATSRTEVIRMSHPAAGSHNGGMMAFGPDDGYLYIGTGDSGGCDPLNAAQDLASRLGKILRIDAAALPYTIPPDNPFAGGATTDDEIWSYGLRNPWRWSFDRITAAQYIGDVGQDEREEVNCSPATSSGGENWGWDRYEGTLCPNPSCGSQGSCTLPDHVPPLHEYDHAAGCSITGGFVYRGCRMSDLHGHYFFADYCQDTIRTFETDATCAMSAILDRTTDLAPGGGLDIRRITSFGEDARGELYLLDRTGELYKLLPEFTIVEVSGRNATPFRLDGDWTWEDLGATSAHPVAGYRVYRADGDAQGPFSCVHDGPGSDWVGGDPAVPPSGVAYFYLVTARDTAGNETRAGNRSDETPRVVDGASACPPAS